jgi:hypothetical protein
MVARGNRPPEFATRLVVEPPGLRPTSDGELYIRAGRPLRLTLAAHDPDGDPLTYATPLLPRGARFDHQQRTLTWRPTPDQVGRHELRLAVSDGRATTELSLTVLVSRNLPPGALGNATETFTVNSKVDDGSHRVAEDLNRDPLTVRMLRGPKGARLDTEIVGEVTLRWKPTAEEVGEHLLSFQVSDDQTTIVVDKTLVVLPEWSREKWGRALVPGVGPSLFATHSGQWFAGGAF